MEVGVEAAVPDDAVEGWACMGGAAKGLTDRWWGGDGTAPKGLTDGPGLLAGWC